MRGPEDMCEPHVQISSYSSDVSDDRALNKSVDFSEYMWMVEEGIENFDKKCEEEFLEECWLQEAYEDMLEEEEVLSTQYYILPQDLEVACEGVLTDPLLHEYYAPMSELEIDMHNLNFNNHSTSVGTQASDSVSISQTRLNPNAPEFVPRSVSPPAPITPEADDDHVDR